jgi:O-antigen/teichoic acid export membrane protein
MLLGPDLQSYVVVICVLACSRAVEHYWAEVLRGQGDIRGAVVTDGFASRSMFLIGVSIVALARIDVRIFQLAFLLVSVTLLATYVAGRRALGSRERDLDLGFLDPRGIRAMLREGRPLLVTSIGSRVIAGADVVIVGTLLGPLPAADYGIALKIAALVAVPLAVINALAPHRVASRIQSAEGVDILQEWLTRKARISSLASAVVLIGLAAVGRPALVLMFGSEYASAYSVMIVLGAGQLVNALVGPSELTLINLGFRRVVALNNILFASALIVLCSLAAVATGNAAIVAASAAGCMAIENLVGWQMLRSRTGLRTDAWTTKLA